MTLSASFTSRLHHVIARDQPGTARQQWQATLLLTVLVVILTSCIAWLMVVLGFPSPESLGILFVIPVLFSAVLHGLKPALVAVIMSVLAYNFVLLPPIWDIHLLEPENFAKMGVLSLVALVASTLAGQIRILMREALQREQILSGVYALSQDMLGIANKHAMKRAAEIKLSSLLLRDVTIVMKEDLADATAAMRMCMEENIPVGVHTRYFSSEPMLYLPLANAQAVIGIMCIAEHTGDPLWSKRFSFKILATLAAQTTSALDKATLSEEHEHKLRIAEREKFLSALLSSVSHDFKTPLVTVIGAFSSLKDMKLIHEDSNLHAMVIGGLEQSQKLNRFINNLVEISRLESGLEKIRHDTVSLRDMLASALKSLRPMITKQQFSFEIAPDFPLLHVNAALMELVFLNLLENAIKYGPEEGSITVTARHHDNGAIIDIEDDGKGIPASERDAIFIKFYRSKDGDRRVAGTGLGLYICRGILHEHGGSIAAIDPHDGHGACVRIVLPIETLVAVNLEHEQEES